MSKRIFLLELVVGILGIILVLFFGVKGIAIMALYAIAPFIRDKRESTIDEKLQFHRTNSITFVVVMLFLCLLFFLQEFPLFTHASLLVRDVWFYFSILFMLFVRGITGLIMFKLMKK